MAAPSFAPELVAIMDKCKVPQEIRNFLLENEFLEPVDVKFIGSTDAEVVQALKDGIPADKAPTWDLGLTVKTKKFWTLCGQRQGVMGPAPADRLGSHRWTTRSHCRTACRRL